jgi:RecA-family ATPase
LVPAKSVVLAGFGGTSKTQLAFHLAVSIALGTPFAGKTVKQGSVMMCLGEEDREEIGRRINAIVRKQSFNASQIQLMVNNIRAFPLVGHDTRLAIKSSKVLTEGKFGDEIIASANAIGDVRLLVLDHLGLFHGGDFNAREEAALTMRLINHIALETGASVLLLAHTPKSAIQQEASDASMVAGSTAFVDQARGAWVLATMRAPEAKTLGVSDADRKAYASLAIVKNNYGPTGEVMWFKRVSSDGVGLLEPVVLNPQARFMKAAANIEMRVVVFVTSNPGRYSRTRLRDTQSGKTSGALKASKAEVDMAVDMLLADGRLVNRPPSVQERAATGWGPA